MSGTRHYANWPVSTSVVIWRSEKQKQKWFPVHDSSERQGLELHGQSYTLSPLCSTCVLLSKAQDTRTLAVESEGAPMFLQISKGQRCMSLWRTWPTWKRALEITFSLHFYMNSATQDTQKILYLYWMQRYKVFIMLTFLRELFFKTRENTEQNALVKQTAHLASKAILIT